MKFFSFILGKSQKVQRDGIKRKLPSGYSALIGAPDHGVVYYTEADDGYRVITTMAAGEENLPVTLTESQAMVISVPGELAGSGQALEISRAKGKLVVAKVGPTQ